METIRTLAPANPDNVELRVSLASILIERGDAALVLAKLNASEPADRSMASRDYDEAVQILTTLMDAGEIEGSDLDTLEKARQKAESLRDGR